MNKIFTHIAFFLAFLMPFTAFSQQAANLVYHWDDSTLVGSFAYDNTYNEVWGMYHNGREYAVIGSTAGTHFFDVTDINNVSQVAFVAGKTQGGIIIHRDYHDHNGYLYAVADEGQSSLQIIDFTTLPDSVSVVYDSDALIQRSHNIFIDTATNKLYSLASRTTSQFFPIAIYDISNPTQPSFMASYNSFDNYSIGHVHDGFIRNDTAYLNGGYDGLFVVDFSNTTNAQLLGVMQTYPNQGYNHSGWLNPTGDYYYMGDENHGKPVKVVKTDDLSDLQVINNMNAGVTSGNSIPHNIIWHDHKVFVSYYYEGLQVYDVSNPASPQRIFYYDTYPGPTGNSYKGAWGVYPFLPSGRVLVSDMQTGLYVFELSSTSTTSVDKMAQIKVFPQPFQQEIHLTVTNPLEADEVMIQMMDATGRVVESFGVQWLQNGENNLSMAISNDLPSGLYFLHIRGKHIQITEKLVKK